MKLSDITSCIRVGDVCTTKVLTAGRSEPLSAVAGLMQKHNVGAVVIVEKERPIGIVTDRDVALAVAAKGISRQHRWPK